MTNTNHLRELIERATKRPWGIWFEEINGMADKAIQEFVDQVHATDPIGNSLVMLDADGKCPAITGCGPTSADNAALIVALVNQAPAMLDELDALREAILAVVAATRAYLPPDGIDAQECLSRILGATDNPEINPIILEAENGR